MLTGKSRSSFYTGDKEKGNPYLGDLEKAIIYDKWSISNPVVIDETDYSKFMNPYRSISRKLVRELYLKKGQKGIDLGSGTGESTLEILLKNPNLEVKGIEISEGMLDLAKYKFNKSNGEEIKSRVRDFSLLEYWSQFRKESNPFKNKVEFILADFEEIDLHSNSIDFVVASSSMHWLDLPKAFDQLYTVLKPNKKVVWNSASHFYNDSRYPSKEYGFRYNHFLERVIDEVKEHIGNNIRDYHSLSIPPHNLRSIQNVSSDHGFETKQVNTYLAHRDLQDLIVGYVPTAIKELLTIRIDDDSINRIISESISKVIKDPEALKDNKHKYDVIPLFISIKQ